MKFIPLSKLSTAKRAALVGIMAATLECAKLALAALPNIEAVTLLTALFGYCFGWLGVLSSLVFVMIEPLIWGFGSWVVTYFIYWPLVAAVFMLLGRRRVKNRWLLCLSAVGLTLFFGLLSSVVDTAFFLGINENYPKNLLVYYLRGAFFYIVQLSCNFALFITLFNLLAAKIERYLLPFFSGKPSGENTKCK